MPRERLLVFSTPARLLRRGRGLCTPPGAARADSAAAREAGRHYCPAAPLCTTRPPTPGRSGVSGQLQNRASCLHLYRAPTHSPPANHATRLRSARGSRPCSRLPAHAGLAHARPAPGMQARVLPWHTAHSLAGRGRCEAWQMVAEWGPEGSAGSRRAPGEGWGRAMGRGELGGQAGDAVMALSVGRTPLSPWPGFPGAGRDPPPTVTSRPSQVTWSLWRRRPPGPETPGVLRPSASCLQPSPTPVPFSPIHPGLGGVWPRPQEPAWCPLRLRSGHWGWSPPCL